MTCKQRHRHTTANRKFKRKQEIENVAFREFADKGYPATRTDDIAAKAGVSKGTIYLYYESKEALFTSALKTVLQREVGAMAHRAEATELAPSAFLRGPFTEFLKGFSASDTAAAFLLLLGAGATSASLEDTRLRQVLTPLSEALGQLIRRGVTEGEFEEGPLERLPELLLAPAVLTLLPGQSAEWSSDLVDAHIELMLTTLRSPNASAGVESLTE